MKNLIERRLVLQGGLAAVPGLIASARAAEATDPADLTLEAASELVRRRRISPVELTKACLARIERLNPKLNAFTTIIADRAVEQARVAEKEVLSRNWRGPLHGIPIGIKDNIDIAGVPTTEALAVFRDRTPAEDSEVVRRLKAAGAVILGKHNLHEIALGMTSVISCFGPVHNPWSLAFIAGGSSGGSAAAIAARLCFGAAGTDAGGSIRLPAAYCGVVGLKPTYGLVGIRGGGGFETVNHIGPLARSVTDAALLLQQMAGFDERDSTSVRAPVSDYIKALRQPVKSMRVGLPRKMYFENLDPGVEAGVTEAIVVLRHLAGAMRDVEFPQINIPSTTFAEVAALHSERFEKTPGVFHATIRQSLERAGKISAGDYIRNRQALWELRRHSEILFPDVDVLVTPAIDQSALTIEDALKREPMVLNRNVGLFNKFGVPAISVPCGFDRNGLPIGLQIVGRPFQEGQVLALAHAYEQATEWNKRRPSL